MDQPNQNPPTSIDELVKKLSGQGSNPPQPTPTPVPPRPTPPPPSVPSVPPSPKNEEIKAPPAPAPISPSPVAPPSGQQYQSSIRTMADDIGMLQKGKAPAGVETSRVVPMDQPKAVSPAPAPAPVAPSQPLPKAVVTPRPNPGFTIPTVSGAKPSAAPLPSSPSLSVPSAGGLRRVSPTLWGILVAVVVVAGGLYWFMSRDSAPEDNIVVQPTETSEPTPTSEAPAELKEYFAESGEFEAKISAQGNDLGVLSEAIKVAPAQPRMFVPVVINEYDANNIQSRTNVDLIGPLATRWGVTLPENVQAVIGQEQIILSYGQTESYNSKGVLESSPTVPPSHRMVVVAEILDTASAKTALMGAEPVIISSWTKMFSIVPPTKPTQFSDNIYKQNAIRFVNFPNPDTSIDYVIVNAENGKNYLIVAGSRESAYAAIDKLLSPPVSPITK